MYTVLVPRNEQGTKQAYLLVGPQQTNLFDA